MFCLRSPSASSPRTAWQRVSETTKAAMSRLSQVSLVSVDLADLESQRTAEEKESKKSSQGLGRFFACFSSQRKSDEYRPAPSSAGTTSTNRGPGRDGGFLAFLSSRSAGGF